VKEPEAVTASVARFCYHVSALSAPPATIRAKNSRRWMMTIVVLVLVGTAAFGVRWFRGIISPTVDFSPMKFDSEGWRSSKPEFSWESVRLRMVDDLLARKLLAGNHKEEVRALLGSEDSTEYFAAQERFVYFLGQERHPFGIDSEWLLIDFGSSGKVSEAQIWRD